MKHLHFLRKAAILAVQEELNRILNAKFETAIELHAIPYDEYERYKRILPYYISIEKEGKRIG